MAKLVRHLTSNEEIVSSTLAEGICYFFNISFVRCGIDIFIYIYMKTTFANTFDSTFYH